MKEKLEVYTGMPASITRVASTSRMPDVGKKAPPKALMNDFEQLAKKHHLSTAKAARILNVVNFEKKARSRDNSSGVQGPTIIHNISISATNNYNDPKIYSGQVMMKD